MRLESLRVEKLPGIDKPLELRGTAPGVNVVVGPNAAGKSSLVRALLALLYPGEVEGELKVAADVVLDSGDARRVERLGSVTTWSHAGSDHPAPEVIPWQASGAYFLRVEDLVIDARHAAGTKGGAASGAGPTDLDRAVAKAISRELTGGIDMDAVVAGFGKLPDKGWPAARELKKREDELRELRVERDAVARREERLPELEAELQAAKNRFAAVAKVREAAELLEANAAFARASEAIAALGPGLEALDERAGDRLADAEEALAASADRLRRAETRRAEAAARLADLALPDSPPSAATAQAKTQAARVLQAAEEELRRVEQAGSAAHAEYTTVLKDVGVDVASSRPERTANASAPDLSVPALGRVEALVARRLQSEASARALTEELRSLEAEQADDPEPPEEHERAGVEAERSLRAWFAAGGRWPGFGRRWGWAVTGVLTGAALAAATLWAPLLADWPRWAPPLVGAAAAGALAASLTRPWMPAARRAAQAAFWDTGLEPPDAWDELAVARRLAEIAGELEALRVTTEMRQVRAVEAQRVRRDLSRAQAEVDEAATALGGLRQQHGYAPALPDSGFAVWLQAAARAHALRAELARLSAERARLRRDVAAGRQALADYLVANAAGFDAPDLVTGVAGEILAACQELEGRLRLAQELREQVAAAADEVGEAESGLQAARAALARLLTDLGLEPEDVSAARLELKFRLDRLPEWRRLSRDREQAAALGERLRRRLEGSAELLRLAEAGEAEALASALSDAAAAEADVERLAKAVNDVRRDVETAVGQRRVERAAGAVSEARDRLVEHRAKALRLELGARLVAELARRHGSSAQPAALALAAELFARFTAGYYRLALVPESGSDRRLVAYPRGAKSALELGELSTGTRAQLLLASRVAFALGEEEARAGRERLPLFLDEALTTADPVRFEAVARALLELAEDGRQVFYLSARPDDARAWQEAAAGVKRAVTVIELGAGRPSEAAVAP